MHHTRTSAKYTYLSAALSVLVKSAVLFAVDKTYVGWWKFCLIRLFVVVVVGGGGGGGGSGGNAT